MSKLDIITREGKRPYPPRRSELTSRFWDELAEGRFLSTRCDSCSKLTFPPKSFCPHCWNPKVSWVDVPKHGTVYSSTTVHIAPATFAHEAPYDVCIVDLDVGMRIATRLLRKHNGPVPVGTRVELVVLRYEDGPLFGVRAVA
jgi:uncharacterized OB-fold protein